METPYLKSITKMAIPAPILLEDNDPKHTAKVSKEMRQNKGIQKFENYHPSSPDLNLIENLWSVWEKNVHLRHPHNLQELRQFANEEWERLNKDRKLLESLISSMPNRLDAVIKNNGSYTEY